MPDNLFNPDTALVTADTLQAVYAAVKPYTQETPLLHSPTLSKLVDGNVWIKAESLQVTGAFKFRGALYRLMQLTPGEKQRGVAAYSSGNFARGLAQAGKMLGIPVSLVMPHDAPKNKIDNAQKLGAAVTLCHETLPSREEAASKMATVLAKKEDYTLLHPFDDPILIKGQAAVGVELQQQLQKQALSCDNVLCPAGGGSLVAGTGLSFSPTRTHTALYAIEVTGFDGLRQSLEKRTLARAKGGSNSCCDALLALSPGQSTFEYALHAGVKGLTVGEPSIIRALQLAFSELHLVLEPSGAVGIAAVLDNPSLFYQQNSVVIASGGNVDTKTFTSLLSRY